jgi:hypothetical protein
MYSGTKGAMLVDTAIELNVVDFSTSVAPSERNALATLSRARGQSAGSNAASKRLSIAVSMEAMSVSSRT